MVEKKFKTLRFASGLFKVLAWIALVGGIIWAFVLLISLIIGGSALQSSSHELGGELGVFGGLGAILAGILSFIGIVIGSLISFVVLKAISEMWELYISVEENVRLTAYYLSGGAQAAANSGMMPPPPIR